MDILIFYIFIQMTFSSTLSECNGVTDVTLPENLEDPQQIATQILTIQNNRDALLEQFKTRFVAFRQNPQDAALKTAFDSIQAAVTNINAQIYSISGKIEISTEELNKRLFCLNALIREEKRKNQQLKHQLGKSENKKNASNEMIYDYKDIYEKGYLRNWGLFLSIILVIILTKKMFPNSK
jgi:hypothetical protein